jgi:dTDP-glucose 4,6-dehydratase
MYKNVLVTGGCGFIASNFLNIMKEKYPTIHFVNIDKLDYCSNVENVKPGVATFVKGNVGNEELVEHLIQKYSFDVIFNFAAQSHVDNSFESALSFTRDNTYATHVLIECCRRHIPNVEFIHFSTDEVYGESKTDTPFTEEEGVLRPTNPYAASKAAAEMIVRSYIESFGMNAKIIRCNNVYGPNQYPEKLIPKFKRLLKDGKKCTIHGKNSSNIKRAFMHVEDVVDAVEVVWKKGVPGEVYNIASDDELTVMEVTRLIIEAVLGTTDYDKWITYVDDRPFNDERYYICAKKLKALGWSQKKTREDIYNHIKES